MYLHHTPLEGLDGYLFHQDHDVIEQLSAAIRLRKTQLATWNGVLSRRAEWCAANGAIFRELIIPEKHVVYADKLPNTVRLSERRPVLQILGSLDPAVRDRVLYPVAALRQACARQPTFFRTDTHWCGHGAYVGYEAIVASLAADMDISALPRDQLEYEERRYIGDLGVRFQDEREEMAQILRRPAMPAPVFQNHKFDRGAVHIFKGVREDLPRCVLFRDSFASFLFPFLVQNFSRIVAVSSMSFFYDLLEEERPDVVLSVTIERFLATFGRGAAIEMPEDLVPARTFVSYCGIDLHELKRFGNEPAPEPVPVPVPAPEPE